MGERVERERERERKRERKNIYIEREKVKQRAKIVKKDRGSKRRARKKCER